MKKLTIECTDWTESNHLLTAVRTTVFVDEQKVPVEVELDEFDQTAQHWLASFGDIPVGTCRMLADGHIGRLAVLKDYRNLDIGKQLLTAAIEEARKNKLFEVYLYAQTHALGFYKAFGFTAYGEEFMDAGIPHLSMRLQLEKQRLLGKHGGNFSVNNFASFSAELVQQATKQVDILSFDFAPDIFATDEMITYLSALARKNRYTEIRLLVVDTTKLTTSSNPLLTLQRRLNSSIKLRKTGLSTYEIRDNLIIADRIGVLVQSIKEPGSAWGNFNNKPVAENYLSQFDILWQQASEDPNLRALSI
ncbi:MAG: GNAT family N-acetyltransferase [Oceanicoccus sp.]